MVLFNATGGPRGDKEDLGQKALELELVEFGNILKRKWYFAMPQGAKR